MGTRAAATSRRRRSGLESAGSAEGRGTDASPDRFAHNGLRAAMRIAVGLDGVLWLCLHTPREFEVSDWACELPRSPGRRRPELRLK